MGLKLLRDRVATLRLSLLAAAGLVPAACGGAFTGDGGSATGEGGTGGTRGSSKPSVTAGRTGTGGGAPIAGTGPTGSRLPTCTAPEHDPVSGLVTCQEGYSHRPTAVVCAVPGESPAGNGGVGGAGGDAGGLPRADGTDTRCGDDTSVCDAFDLGYCQDSSGGGGVAVCRSGCRTDQDCDREEICLCEAGSLTGGTCVPADCVTDRDCAPGFYCVGSDPCGYSVFTCQTAGDECLGNAECGDDVCLSGFGEAPRSCGACPTPGRPFLVAGATRVAKPLAVSEWSANGLWTPDVTVLAAAERQALAEHWTRMGQMEHASIAAFARFALQLLSLGAPPELLEDCTRALADETAHARLCFGIASAYAGRAVGPGPLDVTGSLDVTSLADIVDLVILEGCFGETNAALEALEAARSAEDPVIAAAYARIAEDEQRHAELAFRFMRWALERDPHLVRGRLQAALVCPPTNDASAEDLVVPVLYALLRNGASRELAA